MWMDLTIKHRKTLGKAEENGGLRGFYRIYPVVITNLAIENEHRNSGFSH